MDYFSSGAGCKLGVCSSLPLRPQEQCFCLLSCKEWVAVSERRSWKPDPVHHDCKCSQSLERRFSSQPLLDANKGVYV